MAKNANANVFDDLFVPEPKDTNISDVMKNQPKEKFSSVQEEKSIKVDVTENQPKEKSKDAKDALVQKGIYLTEKQVTAIKIKAATSSDKTNKDMSAIIRAALNIYLADELEKM